MKYILGFLLLLIVGLAAAFLFPTALGTSQYVDFSPPTISLARDGGDLVIETEDSLAGVTSVLLKIIQEGSDEPVKALDIAVTESGSSRVSLRDVTDTLRKKETTFTATSIDDSFWKNQAEASITLELDTSPPQITILSLQHRMYAGGAELIVFEARDNQELTQVSLTVDEKEFSPLRLSEVSEEFADSPDAFALLFAVPRGFSEEDFNPTIVAEDSFGNRTSVPLSLRFVEKPLKESSPSLSQKFLVRKIPPLVDEMKRGGLIENADSLPLVSAFKEVNESYRAALGERLTRLLSDRVTNSIPTEPFVRPMAGKLMSRFGEARNYKFNEEAAGYSTHDGQDIASVRGDKVVSTYRGEVILAELFGIYGNTVVIDHGFGITSLYGHLSSISVSVGDSVEASEEVGKSGETGLAGGDHLHFEIRVQNVPVTPIEWWDKKWFTDNISGKFAVLEEAS